MPTVKRSSTERKVLAGFALALASLVLIGAVAFMSIVRARADSAWVTHTHDVITNLELLLATVADAESGQRGFVITGDESYLQPYERAFRSRDRQLALLRDLTKDNPAQQQHLAQLAPLLAQRFDVMQEVVGVRRAEGFEAAQARVMTGDGKQLHDRIRASIIR